MIKKTSHSFSCEDELYKNFRLQCALHNTTHSREIREFLMEKLKEWKESKK
jgi:hypothetical protein